MQVNKKHVVFLTFVLFDVLSSIVMYYNHQQYHQHHLHYTDQHHHSHYHQHHYHNIATFVKYDPTENQKKMSLSRLA